MQQQQELETTTRGVVRRGEEGGGEKRYAVALERAMAPVPGWPRGPLPVLG